MAMRRGVRPANAIWTLLLARCGRFGVAARHTTPRKRARPAGQERCRFSVAQGTLKAVCKESKMPRPAFCFADGLQSVSVVSTRALKKEGLTPHDVADVIGVELATSTTSFGGVRYWFRCPSCGRRVGVLYYRDGYACRQCNKVVYESQYDRPAMRKATKQFALLLRFEALKTRPKRAKRRKFVEKRFATMTKLAHMLEISLP